LSIVTRTRLLAVAAGLAVGVSLAPAATAAPTPSTPSASSHSVDSGKTTTDGQPLAQRYAARGAVPSQATQVAAKVAADTAPPECPPELMTECKWQPAAYTQNNPDDKSDYGNYDKADRPNGYLPIDTIVIHDTEGSFDSANALFDDSTSYVSAHYLVGTSKRQINQKVRNHDVAWAAGNWDLNQRSINIEVEGHAATGSADYIWAYQRTAALVRYLAAKYHIPLDRQHIIGHDNVPGPLAGYTAGMHYDPAAFWNWQYFGQLVGMPLNITPSPVVPGTVVTVTPNWLTNQPPVTQCVSGVCSALPKQSANFLYLHTGPSDTSPLLSDPALTANGRGGTTRIDDWSAKAVYGQQFVVAAKQNGWLGVFYAGQIGWLKQSTFGLPNALPTSGHSITPRDGLTSVPVYGRAYPEAGAYDGSQVPVQAVAPIQYNIPAGQRYTTTGSLRSRYYWAWTIDSSLPDDHTVVVGHDVYWVIQFNERIAYVKASDVVLK